MPQYFKPSSVLQTTLAAVALSTLSLPVAAEKVSFAAPEAMAQHWSQFAGQTAVGRVRKIEPWKNHETFAPCKADANVCQMIADHVIVMTLDVAKTAGGPVLWLVSISNDQPVKVGEYVSFTFPATPHQLGAGVYDDASALVKPKCRWGKAGTSGASEGVLCDKWHYDQLPFLTQAAPTAAPAAKPSAAEGAQPAASM